MLRTIKGEFDGIYTSPKDFKLIDFHCRKLFSQFDTISGNSKIIFDFKNGKGGKNKIISQAINYQKNAKLIFKKQNFYHIIIIRSKELGDSLSEIINEFVNFAVLCLDNILSICIESFIPLNANNPKEEKKQSNEEKINNIKVEISKLQADVKDIKEKLTQLIEEFRKLNNKDN